VVAERRGDGPEVDAELEQPFVDHRYSVEPRPTTQPLQ
jgi:hypothetical protein